MKLLIVVALSVLAVCSSSKVELNAAIRQLKGIASSLSGNVGVIPTPSAECWKKLDGVGIHQSDLMTLMQCANTDWFLNPTDATLGEFCKAGRCHDMLARAMDVWFDPVCPGPGQAVADQRLLRAALGFPCIKVNGAFCWPKFKQIAIPASFYNPFTDPTLDKTTIASHCDPCFFAVADQMNSFAFPNFDKAAKLLALYKVVCMKGSDGDWCFPRVKDLEQTIYQVETTYPPTSWDYVDKYANVITPKACDGVIGQCFKDTMTGLINIFSDYITDPTILQRYNDATYRLSLICVQDGGSYCGQKIVNAWGKYVLNGSCTGPFQWMTAQPSTVCSTTCPANKLQEFMNNVGCCGGVLRDSLPPLFRNHTRMLFDKCGITFPDSYHACVTPVTMKLGRYTFPNLKWDWVKAVGTGNAAFIARRLTEDFAANWGTYPDNIVLDFAPLMPSSSSPSTQANAVSGTQVTPSVSTLPSDQSSVQSRASGSQQFSSTNSGTAQTTDAAVDPSSPATQGATNDNKAPDDNGGGGNKGAVAAAVICSLLGIAALSVGGWYIWKRHRRAAGYGGSIDTNEASMHATNTGAYRPPVTA